METTRKNKQFGMSFFADAVGIHGQPFAFSIFAESVFCGEVDTVKGVSVQHHWAISGLNERFLGFIMFIAEKNELERKNRTEVNC